MTIAQDDSCNDGYNRRQSAQADEPDLCETDWNKWNQKRREWNDDAERGKQTKMEEQRPSFDRNPSRHLSPFIIPTQGQISHVFGGQHM